MKLIEIYTHHKKLMLYVANNVLNDYYLAEDAVHNAFLVLNTGLHLIEIGDVHSKKCRSLVTIVAKNKAIDIYRQRKKKEYVDIETQYNIEDNNQDIERIIISKEGIEQIISAVKLMPQIYYDVFVLKYIHNLETRDISFLLNINECTVRKRLQIIRQNIKRMVVS